VAEKAREIMLNPMSQPTGVVVKIRTLQRRLEFLPIGSEAGSTLNGSGELRVGDWCHSPANLSMPQECQGSRNRSHLVT
jgi:hypothetical protein